MTIVCVDDHPITLGALAQRVQNILPKADIHPFDNANSALDFARNNGCDVLISEIEFSGTDGLFLARSVKEINPEVNIIFLTVCDEREHAREVLNIRPSGYLVKPAGNDQLEYELKNLRYGA